MKSEKQFTAKEAALEVLKKTHELLAKYETENSKRLGDHKTPIKAEIPEKTDLAYDVDSKKERIKHQISPGKNPKEKAEGNNEPYGTEPGSMAKSSSLKKKHVGFKAVEAKHGASDPAAVAAAVGRKKYGKKEFQAMAAAGKKKLHKEEAPLKDCEKSSEAPQHHEKKDEHFIPPKSIGSAKLSKFMERIHAKRKHRMK